MLISIPAIAIIVSVVTAISVAVYTLHWRRRINRENLTFQHLHFATWDEGANKLRNRFVLARDSGDFEHLAFVARRENEATDDATAVRAVLNNYELLAISIDRGIFDAGIIRRFMGRTLIFDYERTQPFIDEVRKRTPMVWTEYEALYERWRKF